MNMEKQCEDVVIKVNYMSGFNENEMRLIEKIMS